MKRGEVWIASGGAEYVGKPRPVVILQSDRFDGNPSITICALTTARAEAPFARIEVEPNGLNGLERPSRLMIDKITTLPRSKLHRRVGPLSDADLRRMERAILVFLGFRD